MVNVGCKQSQRWSRTPLKWATLLCDCRAAPWGRETHSVTFCQRSFGVSMSEDTGVTHIVCTCVLGSGHAICHFVWHFGLVMWVAAHGSCVKQSFKSPVNTAWCYWWKNKRFMIIGSSQSEKLLQRLFVNRLQMTYWTNTITFVSVKAEGYESRPRGEAVSRWGQRHFVYSNMKYSEHVSFGWAQGAV